jgi:hypothetical protein
MEKTEIIVRIVYAHLNGTFAINKAMSEEEFETLSLELDKKKQIEDDLGIVIHVEKLQREK